jgi:exonuclease SbcD
MHVAQAFAVRPDQLPRAHYIALGHLHKPQEVAAPSPCLYAGSPLQLDFGERGQQKRVVIVDAGAGSPATIESIPLASGRRLREVVTTADQLRSIAADASEDLLRVSIQSRAKISGLPQRVSAILPNAVAIDKVISPATATVRPAQDLRTPRERFQQFLREKKRMEVSAELLEAFDRLYDEARHETDPA